jgi:hypothetical protein
MTEDAMSAIKRAIVSGAILLVLTGWARPAQASIPFINLQALGLELCEQAVCGAAIFAGLVHGQVGSNANALGTFAVAVNHTTLPPTPDSPPALVVGGAFDFRFLLRRIRGEIVEGLIIRNNDDPNTFSVGALLNITSGGSGTLLALIQLDHNVFPPRVTAEVFSCPGCFGFAFP